MARSRDLAGEEGGLCVSGERLRLTAAQGQLAEDFIVEHGAEAFELAMRAAPLFGEMKTGSRWALKSAISAYEDGVPVVLASRLHSGSKNPHERVEHRLLSGDARFVVDFPAG